MNRVITSLIAILSMASLHAQALEGIPKLVVFITVDQLRGDYLQYFSKNFGEGGFKRLINNGKVYSNTKFDFPNLKKSSAVAALVTGCCPDYNGITGDKKYDFTRKKEVSIVDDPTYIGNYTSDHVSPLALLSSTIGDELKNATNGRSMVYSIAPDKEEAIIAAGRQADVAYWIDDYNGKWATTTYYKGIPVFVDTYNSTQGISNTADLTWSPILAKGSAFPYTRNKNPFSYRFGRGDRDMYLKFKKSALVNDEVTGLCSKFIDYSGFGEKELPSLMMVGYYAGEFGSYNTESYGLEIQDTYVRLDKDIENLLDKIDQKVGLKNSLIVLTSTGYSNVNDVVLPSEGKAVGEFYPDRCMALLNMYLMAIYGQGNWLEKYYDEQIYLNENLIEGKKINKEKILSTAADFISKFSGVQDVTIVSDVNSNQVLFGKKDFRNGMHKGISGDIYLEIQPGWRIVDKISSNVERTKYVRNNTILSPLIFFGDGISKEEIYRTVNATEIAPTVTNVLRIRPPNACDDTPLKEFIHF